MSEPSRGTTLLRVIPAAFYLNIPLLCGPLMLLGGILVTLEVPESRGAGILMLLAGFGITAMGIRGTRQRAVLSEVTERGIMFYASGRNKRQLFGCRICSFRGSDWNRCGSLRGGESSQKA